VPPIRAAGGVLWDTFDGVLKVAVIRRPRYDDWSFPKGKLAAAEHTLVAALREVREETGHGAVIGRPLGDIQYLKEGTPKVASYWAMRSTGGSFAPGDEVDELVWLRPQDARRLLTQDRDRDVADRFIAKPVQTTPFLLLRHGSAGDRGTFPGDDRHRPLDATGLRQADALVPLLAGYGIERLLSADVLRCVDTVKPYAAATGLTVESEPLLSESGYPANADAALRRTADIVSAGIPTAVCSQGGAITDLVSALCKTYGHRVPSDPSARKGTFWAMHFAADEMVALERQSALP
jgi:8-oxo-dGTP pyrophosphatase MutT (NUDIX family)/phosphohistidine phosphatase SixA